MECENVMIIVEQTWCIAGVFLNGLHFYVQNWCCKCCDCVQSYLSLSNGNVSIIAKHHFKDLMIGII
jgi:hypothetical protein